MYHSQPESFLKVTSVFDLVGRRFASSSFSCFFFILRDAVVQIGEHCYRVLSVFKQYYGKWFHTGPSDEPPTLEAGKTAPNLKVHLHLLKATAVGSSNDEYWFTTVNDFQEYKLDQVYKLVDACKIEVIVGSLAPQTK